MKKEVVVVIKWKKAELLKENKCLLEKAGSEGRIRPHDWRTSSVKYRSLVIYGDGICEFNAHTMEAMIHRFGGNSA